MRCRHYKIWHRNLKHQYMLSMLLTWFTVFKINTITFLAAQALHSIVPLTDLLTQTHNVWWICRNILGFQGTIRDFFYNVHNTGEYNRILWVTAKWSMGRKTRRPRGRGSLTCRNSTICISSGTRSWWSGIGKGKEWTTT